MDQPQPQLYDESESNTQDASKENKYGNSIFKKWIYAKFDTKLILEVVEKDIYFNLKLSILSSTLGANGKKKFLSASLDLKSLQNLQNELTEAIKILQDRLPNRTKN